MGQNFKWRNKKDDGDRKTCFRILKETTDLVWVHPDGTFQNWKCKWSMDCDVGQDLTLNHTN